MSNLIKNTDEIGALARANRRYPQGRVVAINTIRHTVDLDVGATLPDGSSVQWKDIPYSPQSPPKVGSMVSVHYQNDSPHSAQIVLASVGGQNAPGSQTIAALEVKAQSGTPDYKEKTGLVFNDATGFELTEDGNLVKVDVQTLNLTGSAMVGFQLDVTDDAAFHKNARVYQLLRTNRIQVDFTSNFNGPAHVNNILYIGSVVADTLISSQNDYSPTSFSNAITLYLTATGAVNITGIANDADWRILFLEVQPGSSAITLKDQNTSSAADNRFSLASNDLTLNAGESCILQYNVSESRWRCIGCFKVGGGSGFTAAGDLSGSSSTQTVLKASTTFALPGDITPSQITSNQDDYNPTGLSSASVLRLSTDTTRNLTGLAGGADGRVIVIYNVGSNDLVLKNNSGSSSVANRFGIGSDITASANQGCVLLYDSTASLWRCVGKFSNTGGSGNVTSVGVVGSEPGSPSSGDLYLPSNGVVVERYSGSVWQPWGPIFPFTPPVDGDFAWINQGAAAVDTTDPKTIYLSKSADGSGANIRVRKKTAPSTPYTVTIFMRAMLIQKKFLSAGLCFRQSSDGKLHMFWVVANDTDFLLTSTKYASPTSFTADYQAVAIGDALNWLRIADDGSNRVCSYSADGQQWHIFHTIGRTDYLTANEIGFAISSENNATPNLAAGMRLFHWKEA